MRRAPRTPMLAIVVALLAVAPTAAPQQPSLVLAMLPSAAPAPTFLHLLPHGRNVRHDPGLVASPILQSCVEAAVHRLRLEGAVRVGDLGFAIADLTRTPSAPAFAGVNTTRMVYAASIPKIATLAAAFQLRDDVRSGRVLVDTSNARDLAIFGTTISDPPHADFSAAFHETLRLSMYRSDNAAATAAVETVGFPYVASFVWQSGLYDPREGGGLWVGLGFGRGVSSWRPEPMHGLPHAATPLALVRFYALLGQDRLINAEASGEIRALMEPSAFYNRFRRAILTRYPTAHVYRKTGTMPPWRHDSALVDRPGARYAISGLCRGDQCSQLLIDLGTVLDDCAGR